MFSRRVWFCSVLLSCIVKRATPENIRVANRKLQTKKTSDDICENDEEIELTSSILVEHTGFPGNITDDELRTLEEACLVTYNGMSACAQGFRLVESVMIDTTLESGFVESSRRLQVSPRRFTRLYRLKGICQFCKRSTGFFDDERRRELSDPEQDKQVPRRVKGYKEERSMLMMKHDRKLTVNRRSMPEVKTDKLTLENDITISAVRQNDPCDCLAPSTTVFAAAFNEQVIVLRAQDELTNVFSVEAVTELDEVDCDEDITAFESDVLIEHFGEPDLVTGSELNALELGFVETYNELNGLNSETCDSLFRTVDQVEIFVDGSFNRRLQPAAPRRLFVWLYRVTGFCRGCGTRSNLFDEGVRRSLLPSLLDDRHLQDDGCLCPPDAADRAPTEDEFADAFDETVQFLRATGVLVNVDSVESVTQAEPVTCSEEENTFDSTVAVDLDVTGDLTGSENVVLENAFSDVYNSFITSLCDPFFRRVTDVDIQDPSAAGRMLVERRFFFPILGICRGCPRGSRLFDDATRLRSLAEISNTRSLIQGDECFCSVDPIAERAPAEEEFTSEFRQFVQDLIDDGFLPNVIGVVGVEEIDPSTPNPTPVTLNPTPNPPTPVSDPSTPNPTPDPLGPIETPAPDVKGKSKGGKKGAKSGGKKGGKSGKESKAGGTGDKRGKSGKKDKGASSKEKRKAKGKGKQ